jgi:uncharacterized lipoprotein YmbA
MHKLHLAFALVAAISLGGCSTTQNVTLTKMQYAKQIKSVAQVPEAGNSPEMDKHLESAVLAEKVAIKPPLPAGARKTSDADAIISYIDVWRWDLVMYLQSISIRLHDAESGDLLVSGEWRDSPLHGFRDAKLVVEGLTKEMFAKLRAATKAAP